jgi:nifR3 family TIM-barrel protein
MLNLDTLKLDMPFFQAPLSGYSDYAMRILAREYGAPLTFSGVMLDKISLHPKAIKKLLFKVRDDEHPVGAQILGSNPETMAKSAAAFEGIGYDLIDLNFACPAPKVLRRERGGFLLQKPHIVMEIYRRVRQAVKCPVIMKLRAGFDRSEPAREDFWKICEQAAAENIDALVIHARTVTQRYRGKADWQIIAKLKQKFPDTKIIGSGDILTAETAIERLKESKVDGVLIARGAIGNPWIFSELKSLWHRIPKLPEPSITEQGTVMLRHFEMICQTRPPRKAIPYFRKFVTAYCKRHPERKSVQAELMAEKNKDQLLTAIKKWYEI